MSGLRPQHRSGIVIFAFLFIFSGCSTFQSVTGYFNTYYNCKQLFSDAVTESEAGTQKARDTAYFASYAISPGTKTKFDKVIEKSSKIIQFYEKSAWLDDAMYMIGVSYVYKDENESAIRKFKELEDNFPSSSYYLKAKLWHAKAEYFMKKDEEALKVTKDLLDEARKAGDDDIMLEMLMLEGQIYFDRQDYGQAAEKYGLAVEVSGEDRLRAYSQYQVGIANERMGKYPEAAYAYGRVKKYSPEFNFGVKARLKNARMLASSKEYDRALSELDDLLEERLTTEQLSLTDLEIANTDWAKGDSANAFALYVYIDSVYRGTDAAAKSNYQRGVIYETQYLQFKTSLKHYTKARDAYPQSEINPLATQKVGSLTNYFKYHENIQRFDSLYTIALHTDTASIDPLLTADVMKETTMTNSASEPRHDTSALAANAHPSPGSGAFPNKPNVLQPADSILQSRTLVAPPDTVGDEEDEPVGRRGAGREKARGHDTLTTTPRQAWLEPGTPLRKSGVKDTTKKKSVAEQVVAKPLSKDSLATLIARNKYELAGLFYLELNLPDSGLVWYEDVATNHPTSPLAPRAIYAMSEIYRIKGDSAKVDSLYRVILMDHERTEYALQVRKILKMDALKAINDSAYNKYVEAESLLTEEKPVDAIAKLNDLVTQYPHSQLAPKSIYTIGWIYENLLINNDTAAVWYSRVEKNYPLSIYAEKVHPKLAIKADPKSASQFMKVKEIATVKKTEAPQTARTLNQKQGKGQPTEQIGNDRNANRDDDENVDDNTDDDEPDDSTADDPDDNN